MSDAVPEVELDFLTYSVVCTFETRWSFGHTERMLTQKNIRGYSVTQTQSKFRAFDIMKEIIQQFTLHM